MIWTTMNLEPGLCLMPFRRQGRGQLTEMINVRMDTYGQTAILVPILRQNPVTRKVERPENE